MVSLLQFHRYTFRVYVTISQVYTCNNYVVTSNNYGLSHQYLGYISKNKFLQLKSNNMIDNINEIETIFPNDMLYEACINEKQSPLPFNNIEDKSYMKRPITPSSVDNKNIL